MVPVVTVVLPSSDSRRVRQLNDRKQLSAQLMLSYGSVLARRGEKQKIILHSLRLTERIHEDWCDRLTSGVTALSAAGSDKLIISGKPIISETFDSLDYSVAV